MCKCVSRNTTNSSETKDTGYKANLTTDIIFCDHNKLMESGTSQYLKSTSNSYVSKQNKLIYLNIAALYFYVL